MNNNTRKAFINCTLSAENFIYDPEKAKTGLETIKTIKKNIEEDFQNLLNARLDAFYNIDAMKGGDKYKEDNLFYDISVEGIEESSGTGEHYDDSIKKFPQEIADYLQDLIDKINTHIESYEYYSGRKDFSKTVKEKLAALKGNGDVELSLDELTVLSREEILAKYGLTEADLEKDPNSIEFASEEEKNAYFEALQYMNNDFYNLQKRYSIGNAEEYADKMAALEEKLSTVSESQGSYVDQTITSDTGAVATNTDAGSTDGSIVMQTESTESISSDEGSSSNTTSSSGESSGGGSTQGSVSYRRASSTSVPETSNVESSSFSEHQSEMEAATEKAQNTTAFDERNAYEERIAAEEKAQDEANKAQAAKDEADQAAKVAEQNKTTSTETKKTTTETTSTNTDTSSTTTMETKPTTSEPVSTVAETTTVQPVENVAPVNTQPVTQTAQTTQAASTVSTTVPEIKDMISNGKTATTTQATTTKADPSKMVSSVTSNSTPLKPITIDDTSTKTETTSTAGKFVPPIAGISTAAVAGLGAKLYIDKKDKKDEKKEEKSENKFFNDNIEPEEESKLNFSSKEDIIKLLDR